jgi:RNAse (barnase) inhibitor barstar
MTEIKTNDSNTVYLILDGNKTVDKASFLAQISDLLKFPDYFGHNWDALEECLNDVTTINSWISKEFSYIEDNLIRYTKVNVIWLDPLNFSLYNSSDFYTAVDILKGVTQDEANPLTFVLASNIANVNTELFK